MIQHAVWPTPPPPVTTWAWDQESWNNFEDSYRPDDYTGDRFDTEAWRAYCDAMQQSIVDAFYERHRLICPICVKEICNEIRS
jgi:hypothetical protein